MRGFLTAICFFLFFIAAPLAIFSFIANSVLTPSYIKGKLTESKVYEASANSVSQLVVLPKDVAAQMPEQVKELKAFLAKEITSTYLQTKTEKIVDSTYDWLSGRTEDPPTISFVDLKDKVEAFANSEGLSLTDDINKNFSKPIEIIKPDQNGLKIRRGFQLFQKASLILGVLSGLLLLAIFFLAAGWKSKLRKLSLAFFVTGLLGGLLSLIVVAPCLVIEFSVLPPVEAKFKDPSLEKLWYSIRNLTYAISFDILERILIICGAAVILAIILFVVTIFIKNKPKVPQETPAQPPATQPTVAQPTAAPPAATQLTG